MKKILNIIGIILLTIVGIFAIASLAGEAKLAIKGFDSQERSMIRLIKMNQSSVDMALGKDKPTFEAFSHVSEVLDEDGTLLGYSMDGKVRGAYSEKRYFFTKEKGLLWWGNISPTIDEEGRQHLKDGEGW